MAPVPTKFYFFGDSICFGQYVSPHKTWVCGLSTDIDRVFGPNSFMVGNPSINGDTTRKALERMPHDVQSHAPTYGLVQFGMNDCNFWQTDGGLPRVSPDAFKANLHEIITRLFKFGARFVFLNTNHPSTRVAPNTWAPVSYQENNTRYNEHIRTIAQGFDPDQVGLIDVEEDWRRRFAAGAVLTNLLLHDGVHLSELGHAAYRECVGGRVIDRLRGIHGTKGG